MKKLILAPFSSTVTQYILKSFSSHQPKIIKAATLELANIIWFLFNSNKVD